MVVLLSLPSGKMAVSRGFIGSGGYRIAVRSYLRGWRFAAVYRELRGEVEARRDNNTRGIITYPGPSGFSGGWMKARKSTKYMTQRIH